MSCVHRYEMVLATNTLGSAYFKTPRPFQGEILSIRLDGTLLNSGSTADFLMKRVDDGGTILSLTDFTSPWEYQPRQTQHTLTGGSALSASSDGIMVDGYIECFVTSAKVSATATVHVYYKD